MNRDHEILRALSGQVAEIAALDIHKETEKLYRAVNGLKMIRPVVLIDELPWNQLNGDGELTLQCEDPFLRNVEQDLRRTLYRWKHCPGDMIVGPDYSIGRSIHIGDIGVSSPQGEVRSADEGNNIVSRHIEDQLGTMEAIEKLHVPEITVDDADTQRRVAQLDAIFGDLMPIRTHGIGNAGFFSPWDDLAWWRGVEAIYIDLYDDPDLLHATMRRLLDIKLDTLRRLEEMALLESNDTTLHCTAGLVDELPGEITDGKITRRNLWGRGTAQAFASVSPAMHDEFEIEYMKEFFDGFGLVYYGCCEPLHDKIDIVKKIPNLRKISITPWANVRKSAEQMGPNYVLARKPNPAAVAVARLDEESLRKDILETLTICRETCTPCEFTLKDISSVCYNPENLTRWSQVVLETVKNF